MVMREVVKEINGQMQSELEFSSKSFFLCFRGFFSRSAWAKFGNTAMEHER